MTAALALVVCACAPTDPLPRLEHRLLVHAVLDYGTSEQLVRLQRVPDDDTVPTGETGALVTITGPGGAVTRLAQDTTSPLFGVTYYKAIDFHITPGATYTLHIRAANGDEATGTTTVPAVDVFILSSPLDTFYRHRDTLRMSWPRIAGAAAYMVAIGGIVGHHTFVQVERYKAFADTAVNIPGTAGNQDGNAIFTLGDTVDVVAAAVDDNFHTYYQPFVDPFAGAPPSRIQGALGVFGSIAPIEMRRYVVK